MFSLFYAQVFASLCELGHIAYASPTKSKRKNILLTPCLEKYWPHVYEGMANLTSFFYLSYFFFFGVILVIKFIIEKLLK